MIYDLGAKNKEFSAYKFVFVYVHGITPIFLCISRFGGVTDVHARLNPLAVCLGSDFN